MLLPPPSTIYLLQHVIRRPFNLPIYRRVYAKPIRPLTKDLHRNTKDSNIIRRHFTIRLTFRLCRTRRPTYNEQYPLCRSHRRHIRINLPNKLLLPIYTNLPQQPTNRLSKRMSKLNIPLPILLYALHTQRITKTTNRLGLSSTFCGDLPQERTLFCTVHAGGLFIFRRYYLLSFLFLSRSQHVVSRYWRLSLLRGKNFFGRARLIFTPSTLLRNTMSRALSFHVRFPRRPSPCTTRPHTLPTKQSSSLLRVYNRPLFYVISISPIRPILPSIRNAPKKLLTTICTTIRQCSRYTNLLHSPTRQTRSTPLLYTKRERLHPYNTIPMRRQRARRYLPIRPYIRLNRTSTNLSPLPRL